MKRTENQVERSGERTWQKTMDRVRERSGDRAESTANSPLQSNIGNRRFKEGVGQFRPHFHVVGDVRREPFLHG